MDDSDNESHLLISQEISQVLIATISPIGCTNEILNNFFDDTDNITGEERVQDGRCFGRPGKSNLKGRKDYNDSTWGRMLAEDEALQIYNSDEALLFRLRFRIPYKLFLILLEWTEEGIGNTEKSTDCAGRSRVPTGLKLLGVLRILGRGTCLDGIKELSDMSETTMWKFFHQFCCWFKETIYPKYVIPPRTHAELEKAMGPYAALGLMGAIGSSDAVHIHWGCCPNSLRTLHTGKEGFPTLAYNVTGKSLNIHTDNDVEHYQ